MLGGIFKLTLSFSALFLFITLIWQASITDALPTVAVNDDMVKSNDDISHVHAVNSHTGATKVKRSLHATADQQPILIGRLPSSASSPSHSYHHLKKISHSPNLFRSTGTYNKNRGAAKRIKAVIDNRLKRFRMLDQDEFQEMLKSLSQQSADEQSKGSNGIESIGGMQLANYWSPI